MRKSNYDQQCYDLAKSFLNDEIPAGKPADVDELAQLIQTTIEDYIQYGRTFYLASDKKRRRRD